MATETIAERQSSLPDWFIGDPSHPAVDSVGALVIGGDYRGLGIVRSLGRRGIPVWVMTDEHVIGATSRYARRRFRWPSHEEEHKVKHLLTLAAKHAIDGWVIFPTSDESTALVARHHATLAKRFRLTTPPWESLRWAHDKRLTYQLTEQLGISYPWTVQPRNRDEVRALNCNFPVILKPAIKETFNRFAHDKAWLIEDSTELLRRYDEACSMVPADIIMVQELIEGGGESQLSYAAFCENGHPLASIIARRTRQYPIDFGRSSSYVETVDVPDVEEPARRLLAATGFTGLIEVEFKRDPRNGRYKVLDINPRVWGWHTLGRRAGVDFPHIMWQSIRGDRVESQRARSGVRWIRMVTDVPTVVRELRRGRLKLRDYLWTLRGPIEPAIFAFDDPLPALVEVPLLSLLALRRGAA